MLYTKHHTNVHSMMGCDIYMRPCSLCSDRKSRVVAVCIQDNYNVLNSVRELKHIFIKHNPYSYLLMCHFCLMKLRLFVKCEGPDFTPDIYHRMQDFPPHHTKDTASTTDSSRHIEDTSCQCEHCKAKFGNLPLLAEVVEKIDKRTSPHQPYETEPENLSLKRTHPPPPTEPVNLCSNVPQNLSLKSVTAASEVSVQAGEVPTQVQSSNTVTNARTTPYKRTNSPKESSLSPKVKRISSPVDVCIPESVRDVSSPDNSPSTSTARAESVIHRRVMNCEHCGKCFTHKGDLNKHLRKHTGEQPFECPVCQRKFAHTSNLARHLRVHSGDKPFHCDRCNKSFSRKDKLIMHQKTKLCINAAAAATHSSKS